MKHRSRRLRNYSFQEKKLALETYFSDRYAGSGIPLKQFSAVCGIKYHTLAKWVQAIEWDGSRIEELRPKRKRKPTESPTGLPEPVQELILQLKGKNPSWGPLKIKQSLFRHEQILVPQTSIYRFLKGRGLIKEWPVASEKEKHDRSFEYPYPLAAVQMDLMSLRLASGLTIYLVTLLDDFSRFALLSRFVPVKTMDEVIDVFKECVRAYGVMENMLTDHGSEFVSWQRFTRFEQLLADLEIEYIASGPNKKQNQGKLERWHGTVREALRERGPLDYSSEAQLWIRQVVDHYNYERPHQALGGLVPADRFFGVHEELSTELEQYRKGKRDGQKLYFACRIGERKIVVSGPRADALSVLVNGKRLPPEAAIGESAAPQSEAPKEPDTLAEPEADDTVQSEPTDQADETA